MTTTTKMTCDEFIELAERGQFAGQKVMLIEGEIVPMAAMGVPHTNSVLLTLQVLQQVFATGFVVRPQLPLRLNGISEPEPDFAVTVGQLRRSTSLPTTAVLIVEIADSSLGYDLGAKANLYASANIEDYWVLDIEHDQLIVHRDPQNGVYTTITTHAETELASPLAMPNATILVSDLLP